jgi:hypothetical protein
MFDGSLQRARAHAAIVQGSTHRSTRGLRQYLYKSLVTTVVLMSVVCLDAGAAEEPLFEAEMTCAVYYRMLAGALTSRDMGVLADLEQEKMDRAITLARASAAALYGKEAAEAKFLDKWKQLLDDMMVAINHNYQNVMLLKSRYRERCEPMVQ